MSKTYVVISDTQMPYEDRGPMAALIRFIGDYQPDEVVHIGDVMDYPQPATYSKGNAAEYEGSIFEDSEYGKRHLMEPLRAVYGGPIGMIEGNHDLRPRAYLKRYAPALVGTGVYDFDQLLDFKGFEVTKLPDFYEFTGGWVMTHGHLGGISLNRNSATTALNAAKRFGTSVIMGHTHRLGVNSHTQGYDGNQTLLTGMEVGNLMNMKMAHYLKRSTANWQQGFGLVHVDGKHVKAQAVSISEKRFVVDGVSYSI